jgi:RHS repeat-associated protein
MGSTSYDYGPFGELIRKSGSVSDLNPFQFSTKYLDSETQHIFYGYRFYNPGLGNWLSKDPLGEMGGVNSYCFVGNDNLNNYDLLGLISGTGKYTSCDGCVKKISITVPVKILNGSEAAFGNVARDFRVANRIFAQCCIEFIPRTSGILNEEQTKARLGSDEVLDIYYGNPISESRMFRTTKEEDRITKDQNSTSVIYAYYVKKINSNGEWGTRYGGKSYWFTVYGLPPAPAVVVTNIRDDDTLAHEFGHVLLNSGVHNNTVPNNLMASGGKTGQLLTESQCDQMRINFYKFFK